MQDSSIRIADAALERWQQVAAALSPIIGEAGVLALLRRSVVLRQPEHTCPAVAVADKRKDAFAALHSALRPQTAQVASAADGAVLLTFVDLLNNLIGPALTQRLIGSAGPPTSGGPAAQDKPP